MLLELQVADLQVIPLHADIAAVDRASEALQQVLRDLEIQVARGIGIQAEELAVEVMWLLAYVHCEVNPNPRFCEYCTWKVRVLEQRVGAGQDGVALRNGGVLKMARANRWLDRAKECWDPIA